MISIVHFSGFHIGIGKDLEHLRQFVDLCNENVPEQLFMCAVGDYEMSKRLVNWVSQARLQMKEVEFKVSCQYISFRLEICFQLYFFLFFPEKNLISFVMLQFSGGESTNALILQTVSGNWNR